jgi:hypothetical protein
MRKRRAPRAEPQSDVTRFRGVAVAAVLAAFATAAIAFTLSSPDARRGSPGPLPRPHRLAGLACDSCHGEAPMSQS